MEPWLYGASTGVSTVALIVAAVLDLVVGAHFSSRRRLRFALSSWGGRPSLAFFSFLLSDEQPLTPAEECYHRLLALGLNEASEMAEDYLKTNSLTALYDSVFIPVIIAAEIDNATRRTR